MISLSFISGYIIIVTFWFSRILWSVSRGISISGSVFGMLLILLGLFLYYRSENHLQRSGVRVWPLIYGHTKLYVVLAAAAFLFRFQFYLDSAGWFNSDNAVTGLMAKHISEGSAAPLYFYGQYYLGSLTAHLAGFLMIFFGPGIHVLKIVPFICFSVFLFLQFRFLETTCCRNVAIGASLLSIFAPGHLFQLVFDTSNGFMEFLMLAMVALCLLNRALSENDNRAVGRVSVKFIWSGMIMGLALWVNPQVISVVLMGIIYIIIRSSRARLVRSVFFFICGLVLGLYPVLLGEIRYDWPQLRFLFFEHSSAMLTPALIGQRLFNFFWTGLPLLIFEFQQGHGYLKFLFQLVRYIVPLLLLFAVIVFRKDIHSFFCRRSHCQRPSIGLVLVHFTLFLVIFLLSRFGDVVDPPRYLVVLFFSLPVIMALPLAHAHKLVRFGGVVLIILFVVGGFIHRPVMVQTAHQSSLIWGEYYRFLDEQAITHARCNYWLAYITSFMTREKTICCPLPDFDRIPRYCHELAQVNNPALIYHDNVDLSAVQAMKRRYDAGEISDFGYWRLAPLTVFYPIEATHLE